MREFLFIFTILSLLTAGNVHTQTATPRLTGKQSISGANLSLNNVPHEVDALVAYGGGVHYTDATITSALTAIGTTNQTVLVLRPGTWVFGRNIDWSAYTNVVFKIIPGAVIRHEDYTLNLPNPEAGAYHWLAGTGAVTFTGSLKEILPEWFEVKGDGSTLDTIALQAVINSTDRVIRLGPYTYLVDCPKAITLASGPTKCSLVMKSNMHLIGVSGKTTLRMKDGVSSDLNPVHFNMFASNGSLSKVTFENIIFDLNGAKNSISPGRAMGRYNRYNTAAVMISGADARVNGFRFRNCVVRNAPGVTCIALGQSNTPGSRISRDAVISGSTFSNNGLDSDDHSSIYAWGDEVVIENCRFLNDSMVSGVTGPRVAIETHGARQTVKGNEILNYFQGMWIGGNYTSRATDIHVLRNKFTVQRAGTALSRESSSETLIDRVILSGNKIYLDDTDPYPQWANHFKAGIDICPSYSAGQVKAENNLIAKKGSTVPSAGFRVCVVSGSDSLTDVSVNDNVVVGATFGVYSNQTAGTGTIQSLSINRNKFKNLKENAAYPHAMGVGIINSSGQHNTVKITENEVSGTPPTSGSYCAYLSGVITDYTLDNNVCLNADIVERRFRPIHRKGKQAGTLQ